MRRSITGKITAAMISVVTGTILLCWFINTTFLEPYYVNKKQNMLLDTFEEANEGAEAGKSEDEDFKLELERHCASGNITLMVIQSDGTIVQSNVGDDETLLFQFMRLVFQMDGKDGDAEILESTDSYVLEKSKDSRLGSNYLALWGTLADGNLILLRTALEGIEESVGIANRFLGGVGIVAVIVCAAVIYAVTRRITNPILQLAEISEKMANLDFDAKYESRGEDEIDILGEHMNQLSEALEQTISRLKSANNELRRDIEKKTEAEQRRKEFISNVSHELKTPIALIQGYAEGLKECINDDAESRDFYCEVIMDEADKMNQLVRDLLALSQLESGEGQVRFERFDLTEAVRGVISETAILREQAGIRAELDAPGSIYVWADEFKVEQVVTNYVSNAIHYAAGEKRIRISIQQGNGTVRTEVFNTGSHIPEEEIGHVWEKFYKVDKARTREYGGNGIGLSIVKAIMDSFHRECGARNEEDGVTFWFELESAEPEKGGCPV